MQLEPIQSTVIPQQNLRPFLAATVLIGRATLPLPWTFMGRALNSRGRRIAAIGCRAVEFTAAHEPLGAVPGEAPFTARQRQEQAPDRLAAAMRLILADPKTGLLPEVLLLVPLAILVALAAGPMLLRGGHYESFGRPHDGLGFAPPTTRPPGEVAPPQHDGEDDEGRRHPGKNLPHLGVHEQHERHHVDDQTDGDDDDRRRDRRLGRGRAAAGGADRELHVGGGVALGAADAAEDVVRSAGCKRHDDSDAFRRIIRGLGAGIGPRPQTGQSRRSAEQKAALETLKASGAWAQLQQKLAGRNLEDLPQKVAEIQSRESSLAGMQAGRDELFQAARQSLADPDWFRKLRLGLGHEVRRCVFTNYCEGLDQVNKLGS